MDTEKKIIENIPALSVYRGMPVIKGEEKYEPLQDKDKNVLGLKEILDELSKRFEKVLLTDLNGIERDKPQLELFRLLPKKMESWIDAGTRYGPGIIDILVAGADYVVLSTKTLKNLNELEKALELSENIVLNIDFEEGIVSPHKSIREMSPWDLTREVENFGIETIIFTDLKNLVSNESFGWDVGRTLLASNMKIYFHGRFDVGTELFEGTELAGIINEAEKLL
ncbi:MAG: hypothetical protein JSV56_00910 [Methanomassiliicoccales archaeon]|nr:MAG: hypothetical protein JSV56_00910 [Methanomassiliicoccales archaeon]